MRARHDSDVEAEARPGTIVSRTFPARRSSIPGIREFVQRGLADRGPDPADTRAVSDNVAQALLDATGPNGTIQVSFRIFADHVEVDVVRCYPGDRSAGPDEGESFAEWMAEALRREGLTMEAAARRLGVSVRTVSRWVGGTTEPRLRELRRIHEVLGEIPLS